MEILAITRTGELYRFPIYFDGETPVIIGYKSRDYITMELIYDYVEKVV